jgi:hypothetical protein
MGRPLRNHKGRSSVERLRFENVGVCMLRVDTHREIRTLRPWVAAIVSEGRDKGVCEKDSIAVVVRHLASATLH